MGGIKEKYDDKNQKSIQDLIAYLLGPELKTNQPTAASEASGSLEGDQVLWVGLVILEHHKHGGFGDTVGDAVVQVGAVAQAFVGGGDHAGFPLGEVPHQDPGQVHALVPAAVDFGIAVGRVGGVHREVGAFAVHGGCRSGTTRVGVRRS